MNTKQILGLCTVLLFALFTAVSQARPPKAVLNARQLGVDELDLDVLDEADDEGYVDEDEESEDDADDEEEFVDDEEEDDAEDEEEDVEEDEEESEDDAEDEEEDVEEDEDESEDDAEDEDVEEDEEESEDDAEEESEDVEEDEEESEDDAEDEDVEEDEEESEDDAEDEDEDVEEDEEESEEDAEEEEDVEEDEEESEEDAEEEEDVEEAEEESEEDAEEEEDVEEDEEESEEDAEEEEDVEEAEEESEEDVEEEEDVAEEEDEEDAVEEIDPLAEDDEEEEVEEVEEEEEESEDDEDEVEEIDPLAEEEDEVEEDNGLDDAVEESDGDDDDFGLDDDDDDGLGLDDDAGPGLEEDDRDAEDAAPAAAADVDPIAKSLSEIEMLERIRRQMLHQHGLEALDQGRRALENGNWGLAREKFDEAVKFLQDKESTHEKIREANEGLAEAYYRMALEQTDFKSYEEAEKSIRLARGYIDTTSPLWAKIETLLKRVRELQEHPPVEPPPPRVSRRNQEEYIKLREDFSKRMSVAREYYATGEYREARMHVEAILSKDPYYKPALDLLRKIHLVEHRFSDDERATTREGMIRKVTESWTARNTYGTEFSSLGVVGVTDTDPNEANKRLHQTTDEVRIREKMKNIMLESIEYRQANIVDVINELSDLSRENDTSEGPAEEKGINFMLNIGGDSASAEGGAAGGGEDDFWGEGGGAAAETGDGSYAGIPPLTIKARYISLQTALDMIMEISGLKYRINGNIVMIMRKNATTEEMQHRMYSVLPTIQEVQLSIGSQRNQGSGSQDDPWTLDPGKAERNDDWKTFFGDLGVGWPDGSTVKYMPSIGKLVVRNTPDNLATLEQVLGALNVTPFQVEIEVRFVEVSQLDLNSLGLEWILNDDYEVVENRDDRGLPVASRRRGVVEAGSFNRGFNYLNKNTRLGVNDGSSVMDNIATFTSILSNPEFSVVLHALSNRSNTDMLSAPKVTARTGTTATIKTVTEYVYPTEYEVKWPEESSGDNTVILQDGSTGAMMLPAVEPQEFNMREVGVILQVTPNVSSDGTRISLELQPTVVSDPSWKDYGYTYPIDYRSGEGFHLTMEQPFFPVRSLATQVDIYNGCTVAMGGMIREERFTEEDKIPILGDIPVIGNLFRYKYEQSDKRNLLIFVTARLVDPAGREITGGADALITGVQSDTKQ